MSKYPLDVTIQPILHPLTNLCIKSVSLQCKEKDVVGDCVKGLPGVQTDICSLSLSTVVGTPSYKAIKLVGLAFGEATFSHN